jgi:hypothetical protein
MKFHSIKEYFYKLTTIGFILLLPPFFAFIFLYSYMMTNRPVYPGHRVEIVLLSFSSLIFLMVLTIVHWVYFNRLRKIKKRLELASKMDGFYSISVMRMSAYCACGIMGAIGFYLTASPLFTAMFVLEVAIGVFQWPSPSAFCRTLSLRGAERDMIIHGRDIMQKKNKRT